MPNSQIQTYRQKIKDLEFNNTLLKKQLSSRTNKLSAEGEKKKSTTVDKPLVKNETKKLETANKKVEEMTNKINKNNNDMIKLQEENKRALKLRDQIIEKLNQQIFEYERKINSLETGQNYFQSKFNEYDKNKLELLAIIDELKEKLFTADKIKYNDNQEINSVKNECAKQNSISEDLKQKLIESHKEWNTIKQELENKIILKEERLQSVQSELEELIGSIAKLDEKNKELKKDYEAIAKVDLLIIDRGKLRLKQL